MKRIGILLDDFDIRQWQKKIIDFIEDHPDLKIEVLIVNKNPLKFGKSSFFYRSFQALDRKFFKVEFDAFKKSKLELRNKIPVVSVQGKETKYSYWFPEETIAELKEFDLDVLIRFGFGILKGDILKSAKYGVWSLHHGDNSINRGGPPGFWEVVNREEVTGATLQQLSADLDGGQVIAKSFTKTDLTSFNRNKNEVFWSGVELFQSALNKLAAGEIESTIWKSGGSFYSHPLYKDPQNYQSLRIHSAFWARRLREILKENYNPPRWFLLYKFKKEKTIETSIFRYKKLIPPKGVDWADPFVVEVKEKGFFVFFEELKIKTKKGHISYFHFDHSGDLISKSPTKVLTEDCHLSYPFIFQDKDKYYMIPESANSGELWLYEALEFPDKWKKAHQIFSNKAFYDASLIHHQGTYYLFGTERIIEENSRDQYLCIYYAEDLLANEWKPHPANPIYRDVRKARPAGDFFSLNGKLIRPSQIGAPKYGYGIQFNEVVILSPTEFKEITTEKILPFWEKDLVATHTFNSTGGFSIMDAQGTMSKRS